MSQLVFNIEITKEQANTIINALTALDAKCILLLEEDELLEFLKEKVNEVQ